MKKIIILFYMCVLFIYCNATSEEFYDYPESSEEKETIKKNYNPKNCTKMKFYCESCTDLVMCIDTEYGFMKQYVTCPENTTCVNYECSKAKNPLCDGTADIPFQCHLPGLFPDPFDCKKYHFCIPQSTDIINDNMEMRHFEYSCQDENDDEYMYNPKSTYCESKIKNGCPKWPVPLCNYEGETDALEENKSIFFVCDNVQGHLYPQLFACPHGEEYDKISTKCGPVNSNLPIPYLHTRIDKNNDEENNWRKFRYN